MQNRNRLLGYALIGGGALFLLGQLFDWRLGATFWPLVILVPGLALLFVAWSDTGRSNLLVPGCVLSTLGLIFFVQSATNHYESWAYAWALLGVASGLGMFLQGTREGKASLAAQGRRNLSLGATMFAVGFIFFEGFIFGDLWNTWLMYTGLPVLLILGGGYILYRQSDKERS